VYVGEFEPEFLGLPQECLILTMRQNQKYFPLFNTAGKLTNKFLIVSNMRLADPKNIVAGNQRVIRPRLADARFFFETVKHRQRVFADRGLTPNDARALFVLDGTRGRSMSELADEWLCDASNATWIVDRLEERGLAERRTMPTDRRVKLVVLTPKGSRTREEMFRKLYEPPPELLELGREELEALRDAVSKLPLRGSS